MFDGNQIVTTNEQQELDLSTFISQDIAISCLPMESSSKLVRKVLTEIHISRRSVMRRMDDLSTEITSELKQTITRAKFVSIALDESVTFDPMCELVVFVRLTDNNLTINEKFLELVPLTNTRKGIDVFQAIKHLIENLISQ
ncbi:hypothetical protein SNEBB_006791 [Seison nebaliae]|nr:hypothetical protein SNEBB_006791 [Seison nebaliae]